MSRRLLFVLPLLTLALMAGFFAWSLMAGRDPTIDEAITGLKSAGGRRTADLLVGPGSKQRYLYAKTLTDKVPLVRAIGEIVYSGGRIGTSQGKLVGPDGTLFAHATTTCLIFDAR